MSLKLSKHILHIYKIYRGGQGCKDQNFLDAIVGAMSEKKNFYQSKIFLFCGFTYNSFVFERILIEDTAIVDPYSPTSLRYMGRRWGY